MFEINYSQLIQYEILEKLVTSIPQTSSIDGKNLGDSTLAMGTTPTKGNTRMDTQGPWWNSPRTSFQIGQPSFPYKYLVPLVKMICLVQCKKPEDSTNPVHQTYANRVE